MDIGRWFLFYIYLYVYIVCYVGVCIVLEGNLFNYLMVVVYKF